MKTLFKIGIALLLAFTMSSCEKEDIRPDEQTTKTEETEKFKWIDYIQSFEIVEIKDLGEGDYDVYYVESQEQRSLEGETWYYRSGWGIVKVRTNRYRPDEKLMVKKNDKITFRNNTGEGICFQMASNWISSEGAHNAFEKTDQEKNNFYCKCSFIRDFDTLLEDIRNDRNRGALIHRDLSQF